MSNPINFSQVTTAATPTPPPVLNQRLNNIESRLKALEDRITGSSINTVSNTAFPNKDNNTSITVVTSGYYLIIPDPPVYSSNDYLGYSKAEDFEEWMMKMYIKLRSLDQFTEDIKIDYVLSRLSGGAFEKSQLWLDARRAMGVTVTASDLLANIHSD